MLHEVLLALLGHSGGLVKAQADGLKVPGDLPFLHSSDVEQLNLLCKLGTHYASLNTFIKKYGGGLNLGSGGSVKSDGIHGIYLNAFCSGLDSVLDGYRQEILQLEADILRDPHLSVSYLISKLQQYQLLFPVLVAVINQISSHKAHGCYIMDIVHKYSETGQPFIKEVLKRILHSCHGVMYKHLCSWLLYGYVYDPYKEFFIQPSEGESHDQTSQSQKEEEEDDLGIMGVTGRQLQKMLRLHVPDSSSHTTHLFTVKSDLLPNYIPIRVAKKILFVGESIQMFQESDKTPSVNKGTILKGQQDKFARELQDLARETVFNPMDFECLINNVRTHVAEHLWQMLVKDADLLSHLRIIKDFYLLGRGELYLAFIDQAQHLLKVPATVTTEYDVNAAYVKAARNVLFHDEALLQKFTLTVKPLTKPQKESVSSSSSSGQSGTAEIGWNSLALNYTVKWPLHIFFTPSVLEKYNRIFRFLLLVRRTQLALQHCWTIQMWGSKVVEKLDRAERSKWQLRTHMSFLIDNLQYYLQVDVIESQYGILVEKINTTRDYEAVKLAHDQFLSALLSQSFVHMKSVYHCLHEILDQCNIFTAVVARCQTPMSAQDNAQLGDIAKNVQRQSSLLFNMLSSVRSNSSSPHLAQLLLRLDFNRYFSISGGQLGSY